MENGKLTRSELKVLWEKYKLTTRMSYDPKFIKEISWDFMVSVKDVDDLIYNKPRYREISDNKPRVDGLDFLRLVAQTHDIEPIHNKIELSHRMFGEGSRRQCIEEAYLGEDGQNIQININEKGKVDQIKGSCKAKDFKKQMEKLKDEM